MDQAYASLQGAGPIKTFIWRIFRNPVFQPLNAFRGRAGFCQAQQFIPAAQFPDYFDIRAFRQLAVVQLPRTRHLDSRKIIVIPSRRIIDLDGEFTKSVPLTRENPFNFGWVLAWHDWQWTRGLERNAARWRSQRRKLFLNVPPDFGGAHRAEAVPVPHCAAHSITSTDRPCRIESSP